jgi:hypothetical protein
MPRPRNARSSSPARGEAGESKRFMIFGDDYPTTDGIRVRDYIHVADLADAHVKAVRALLDGADSTALNLWPWLVSPRAGFKCSGRPMSGALCKSWFSLIRNCAGRRLSAQPVASVLCPDVLIESLGGGNIGFRTRGIAFSLFGNPSSVQRAR